MGKQYSSFNALVVNQTEQFTTEVKQLSLEELPPGEVVVQVAYSGVNYKDGLAGAPDGKIVKQYPFVPGIDLAGTVLQSSDARFAEGQKVLATGFGLGVTHFGGFSEIARMPADWLTPLPASLSLREAMIVGTAGLTAAISIEQLKRQGAAPEKGEVLVTGATGGVGGHAIAMLAAKGYPVVASTGRHEVAADYLKQLGASQIIPRISDAFEQGKPLQSASWQGAIDSVGGPGLSILLSKIAYGGSVALSGLTGGSQFAASVMPFILRGVNLLGIDSVLYPAEKRQHLWERIGSDLRPASFELLVDREIGLQQLPEALADILQARTQGRILVAIRPE